MNTAATEVYTLSLHDALPIWATRKQMAIFVLLILVGYWLILTLGPLEPPEATVAARVDRARSEEHTSELQSQSNLVCRLLLEKKNRQLLCIKPRRGAMITAGF